MSSEPRSVPALFLQRVAATPEAVAFHHLVGEAWAAVSWREAAERVRAMAGGLQALGLSAEQRAGILSTTRLEWVLADLAIMCAGGATTTIYSSTTADDCAFMLSDSQTHIVFAEDAAQVAKLAQVRERMAVRKVVLLEGVPPVNGHEGWVITLAELEQLGREWDAAHPEAWLDTIAAIGPERLATILYTSGTTGRPKGVELTHDCWVYEAWALDQLGIVGPLDRQYLWLPLAHVFGKVLIAAQLRIGFDSSIDGRVAQIVANLPVVQPTFMAAPPRVFEKIEHKMLQTRNQSSALKRAIFDWAFGVGRRASALEREGKKPGGWLALQRKLARALVFRKVERLFGGHLRFFVSGSAALAPELAEFFHAAGALILEGYGLSETSAASCANRLDHFRFGTVGLPVPGTELRLDPADNEVLIRGRGVMRGYHGMPEATREALTADGWLRTGDIGELDAEGFLRITDRKKDLIKTSGGKYVAPQKLEGRIQAACPYLSQVLVYGEARRYCVAMVTLDEEGIKGWAEAHGLGGRSLAELAQEPAVHALVQESIDVANQGLASYETVKRFVILSHDLSLDEGELTPTLKLKRKLLEQRYRDTLDTLYLEPGGESALH